MHRRDSFPCSIGRSAEGRDLAATANFPLSLSARPGNSTLLIGGMHGNEPATVALLENFLASAIWPDLRAEPIIVLPVANPDGCLRGTRYNARGVDLNRNFGFNWHAESDEPPGRAPWSEPESCALRDFITTWEPRKIVSLHWALAELDADGAQSTQLAQAMWDAMAPTARAPYRLRVTELGRGQRRLQSTYATCPGSLGQWCGYELTYADGTGPAMITLELPYDPHAASRPEELCDDHLADVCAAWAQDSAAYLRAVETGVAAMLTAACHFHVSAAPEIL